MLRDVAIWRKYTVIVHVIEYVTRACRRVKVNARTKEREMHHTYTLIARCEEMQSILSDSGHRIAACICNHLDPLLLALHTHTAFFFLFEPGDSHSCIVQQRGKPYANGIQPVCLSCWLSSEPFSELGALVIILLMHSEALCMLFSHKLPGTLPTMPFL